MILLKLWCVFLLFCIFVALLIHQCSAADLQIPKRPQSHVIPKTEQRGPVAIGRDRLK